MNNLLQSLCRKAVNLIRFPWRRDDYGACMFLFHVDDAYVLVLLLTRTLNDAIVQAEVALMFVRNLG
jgi:hypothetical protein